MWDLRQRNMGLWDTPTQMQHSYTAISSFVWDTDLQLGLKRRLTGICWCTYGRDCQDLRIDPSWNVLADRVGCMQAHHQSALTSLPNDAENKRASACFVFGAAKIQSCQRPPRNFCIDAQTISSACYWSQHLVTDFHSNAKCFWQNVHYSKHVGRRLWLLKTLKMSNYQIDEEYSNLPAIHTQICICLPSDRQQLLSGAKEDVSRVRSRAACMPKYFKSWCQTEILQSSLWIWLRSPIHCNWIQIK